MKYDTQGTCDEHMERIARRVVTEFRSVCVKLKELKPEIQTIRDWFCDHQRGSMTLYGCRSFKEFCERNDRLNRKEQTVYAMLGNTRKDEDARKATSKARTSSVQSAH
jgi:hypothetical protein